MLALIIALLIKTFLFQAFYIPSESMVPTLKVHDRVLVNKLSYKLHPVHRDDIVVFKAPPGSDPGIDDLVKRVIGLPGETVSGARRSRLHQRQGAERVVPPEGHVHVGLRAGEDPAELVLGDGRQPRQLEGLPRLRRDHEEQDRRAGLRADLAVLAASASCSAFARTGPLGHSATHSPTVATMRSGRSQ